MPPRPKTPIPTDQPPPAWRDILHTEEVSVLTRVPEGTLRYWATQTTDQGPPSFRLGRRRVYRRSAVMEWIAEQERATTNRPQAANG